MDAFGCDQTHDLRAGTARTTLDTSCGCRIPCDTSVVSVSDREFHCVGAEDYAGSRGYRRVWVDKSVRILEDREMVESLTV